MGCVIVTGSGGLIGAEAVLRFAEEGLEVHGIDNSADMLNTFREKLPHVPEDYVHRIGRTGRAGSEGTAISLVSAEERVKTLS